MMGNIMYGHQFIHVHFGSFAPSTLWLQPRRRLNKTETDRPMMMDCSQFHRCDVMHVHRVRIAIGSAAPPLSMQSKIGSRARPMLPSSASLDPLGIGALNVRPPSGFWFRFRAASRPTSSLVRSFVRSFVRSCPFSIRFDSWGVVEA